MTQTGPFSYHVVCKGCRFSRGLGAAELTASRVAVQHHRKNPDHRVEVWRHTRIHVLEAATEEYLPLDVFGDKPMPPPF